MKIYIILAQNSNFHSMILQKWIVVEYLGYNQLSGYHQFQPQIKEDYKTDNFIENIHSCVLHKYVNWI